jgi:hypothetical protein
MRRAVGVLIIGSAVALASTVIAWAVVPEKVLDDPALNEQSSAASPAYFAWSQNLPSKPNQYNTYVQPTGGGPRVRVNPEGTRSYTVGIDGSMVVYDAERHNNQNVRFFDAATEDRPAMPDGVNTSRREFRPTLSGSWLLFTRDNINRTSFERSWTKVILFNIATEERRVLRAVRSRRAYLVGDQVNGNWATFERCRFSLRTFDYSNCNVFRYNIATQATVKIANPGGQQYAAAIAQDGTIYMIRTGAPTVWHCGRNTRVVRFPIGGPGVVIGEIRTDALTTFATDETDTSTTLYLQKLRCNANRSGIYRIPNADTAT